MRVTCHCHRRPTLPQIYWSTDDHAASTLTSDLISCFKIFAPLLPTVCTVLFPSGQKSGLPGPVRNVEWWPGCDCEEISEQIRCTGNPAPAGPRTSHSGTDPLQTKTRLAPNNLTHLLCVLEFEKVFVLSFEASLKIFPEMLLWCQILGFCGVQIGSHVNEWNLSAPELLPVFQVQEQQRSHISYFHFPIEKWHASKNYKQTLRCVQKAAEVDMAVFVHPWDMQLDGRMTKYWLPWLVGK